MATQKPMEALFCRCDGSNPVFDDPPVWLPRHLRADRSPQVVTFRFWVHPNDVVWDTDISAELEDGLLCLVEDVTFETAHRVSSVWPMVSFEWFSRDMDASAAEPRARRARRSPHLAGEVEEWETAWFSRVDGVPLREGGGRAAAEEGKGDPATHAIGPLDAEGEAEAWVAVDEARAWVERHAPPDIGEDFFRNGLRREVDYGASTHAVGCVGGKISRRLASALLHHLSAATQRSLFAKQVWSRGLLEIVHRVVPPYAVFLHVVGREYRFGERHS